MVVTATGLLPQQEVVDETTTSRPDLHLVEGGASERFTRVEVVHPSRGIILRQGRQVYDPQKIEGLARSLMTTGQINATEIASLDDDAARRYIEVMNAVWGTRYTLRDLPKGPTGRREVYIDGHTRKLAAELVISKGGEIPGGWRVVFHYNITAEEALERQFQENIHSVPETWEDADAVYRFWIFKRRVNPGLTVAEFSGIVGRSESTVRDYIKFGDAPASVQDAVRSNQIAYGIGLLLARAVEMGAISQDLLDAFWLPQARLPQSVQAFRRSLLDRIGQARNGQDDLFGELDPADVRLAYQRDLREVVAPELLLRVRQNIKYFRIALELDEEGAFGPDGAFSGEAVYRVLLEMAEVMEKLLPSLQGQVTRRDRGSEQLAADVLAGSLEVLASLAP